MRIRIIKAMPCKLSVPPRVSEAWVGVELESIGIADPSELKLTDRGLIAGQKPKAPYLVFSEVAFQALRAHNKWAYDWWKTVYPEKLTAHKTLEFHQDACEVCEELAVYAIKDHLTWEEVLERDDIVGGQLETFEGGYHYRGQISEIKMENEYIHIKLGWTARMALDLSMLSEEPWKPCIVKTWLFGTDIKPTDIGNNRLSFGGMSRRGSSIIFSKSDEDKLDPASVKGLKI